MLNTKLLGLAKYGGLKSSDLTPQIIGDIAAALGKPLEVTTELQGKVMAALTEDKVDTLIDVLQRPELIGKLTTLFERAEGGDDNLIICPHCGEYLNPQA